MKGAWLIEIKKFGGVRFCFGRAWCRKELEEMGLTADIKQLNASFSPIRGTLRDLHYRKDSYQEVKIIRCTQGRIFDVIVDLRPESAPCRQWIGYELSEKSRRMLYGSEGCATGFLSLENNCSMYYPSTEFYAPESAPAVRYNDPAFGIEWPGEAKVISEADSNWPDFDVKNF